MEEVESVATASSLRLKFVAPVLAMEPIERPRVLSRLVASTHARLLLLCAPAGFSKTITLGQYACARQTQGWDVLWLSLEAQDNQPSHFISRLINAFAEVKAEQGDAARALLELQPPLAVAEVMERLLADVFQCLKPTLLVLDDAQVIQQPELLAALKRMVSLAPANFTVALACRSLPALNLATLRAKGMLTELGVDELKFTLGESQALFQQRSIALDAQQLEPLFNDTEGWPMALHQAFLWLQSQPNLQTQAVSQLLSGVPGVDDYVQRTVFEPLSAELQDALLTLGVSRQICGDLANTLMGRQDGQQLLEQLESLQLFLLPLDRSRHWYRFHPVFAGYLRTRLRAQNPERFKQLHFNASLWFTNHHMLNLALEHAHQAEDPQMLAALLDACGLELINRGQLGLIYKWRKQVPDVIAEGYPVLVMADVWTRASEMGLGEANRLLDGLLSRWTAPAGASAFNDQVLASLAIKTMIALQKDDLDTCITLARRIEMQLGKSSAFLEVAILIVGALALMVQGQHDAASKMLALAQQRNHFLEGRYLDLQVLNVEMLLALDQGHSKRAQLLCEQLTERFKPWFAHRSRAMVLPMISEALIDYSQGRFDGLPERLRWALDKVDVINPIDLNAQAMLCLARVQRLQDATRESAATLILMQNLAARYHSWRFYAQAVGEEIALILQEPAADRTKRAEQRLKSVNWAKLASAYQHREFNPVLWVQSLTRIRLQQARGHYSEALHEIAQLKTQLQGAPYPLHMLRLDLLSALSYQRLGYQERAQSLLLQCLVDAEREELRSLFMEEGEAIRQMLQQLESAERHPGMQGFLRSILSIWPGREAQQLADVLEDGLTEREREVVCLAAKGLSNEEISQQLSLALGTVKWHLHNIYEKLKVRNRTQAIRRARELSLLES